MGKKLPIVTINVLQAPQKRWGISSGCPLGTPLGTGPMSLYISPLPLLELKTVFFKCQQMITDWKETL